MNKTTGIIIGIVVLAVIAGMVYGSSNKKGGDTAERNMIIKESEVQKDNMINGEQIQQENISVVKDNSETIANNVEQMVKSGFYEAYAPEKLALAETGDVVLFFHASWCPSCRGLNADIEKNLNAIPSNVSILKVDYDKESELKKKYGVTSQHTLVQVTADGTMIKKWSGSSNLSNLVSQIN